MAVQPAFVALASKRVAVGLLELCHQHLALLALPGCIRQVVSSRAGRVSLLSHTLRISGVFSSSHVCLLNIYLPVIQCEPSDVVCTVVGEVYEYSCLSRIAANNCILGIRMDHIIWSSLGFVL